MLILKVIFLISTAFAQAQTVEFSSTLLKPEVDEIKYSQSIDLKGSINETLFALIRFDGLTACNEFKIILPKNLSADFKLHRLNVITAKNPSYPKAKAGDYYDIVTPVEKNSICPGGKYFILEIKFAKSNKPGNYKFDVEYAKNKYSGVVKLWKMHFPDTNLLQMYSEYAPYGGVLGHFGKWDKSEEALADKYFSKMREFDIQPVNGWVSLPTRTPEGDSFPAFKTQWLGQFVKSKYAQLPGRYDTVKQKDWKTFYEYIGKQYSKLDKNKIHYIYLADEPKKEEIPKVIEAAKLVRKYIPKAKILVTTDYSKELDPYVDIFVVVASQWKNQNKKYPKKDFWLYVSCMSHGCDELVELNNPDFVVERSSAYIRSLAWLMNEYGLEKFLYYQVNYQYQFYPKIDPIKDIWAFSGNGDGTLMYPGRPGYADLKEHTPLLSLRLFVWKQTAQDYQYLKWIGLKTPNEKNKSAKQPNKSSKQFVSLKKEIEALQLKMDHFPKDANVYENLRIKIGEYLNDPK